MLLEYGDTDWREKVGTFLTISVGLAGHLCILCFSGMPQEGRLAALQVSPQESCLLG